MISLNHRLGIKNKAVKDQRQHSTFLCSLLNKRQYGKRELSVTLQATAIIGWNCTLWSHSALVGTRPTMTVIFCAKKNYDRRPCGWTCVAISCRIWNSVVTASDIVSLIAGCITGTAVAADCILHFFGINIYKSRWEDFCTFWRIRYFFVVSSTDWLSSFQCGLLYCKNYSNNWTPRCVLYRPLRVYDSSSSDDHFL